MKSSNRSRPDRLPRAGSEVPEREVVPDLLLPAVEDLCPVTRSGCSGTTRER
jgi:hypothetical protein